ncbi:DNA polymerase [Sinorhizobium meliloti]|uniref:DNA polymerase n=1 Tax=Rhizobium meliloti TaxID=382 RepID=UPI000FE02DFF|nr:DNA polymerase [Sinorhizobium meliloti]RVM00647.1 DNA polymerase [Sinorhizobium meliloti]
MTTIHSLVVKDVNTGEVGSFADQPGYPPIKAGLDWLMEADFIAGHNIVDFDIPAIQKLHPWFQPKAIVRDTIVMSRLMWADMKDADFRQEKRKGKGRWIDQKLFGRHSLESWGQRLGVWKGDYGKEREAEGKKLGLKGQDLTRFVWGTWSKSMQDYCVQDVEVTEQVWQKVNSKGFSEESIQLEHCVRRIISRQERYGFAFDERMAVELLGTLSQAKADAERELLQTFKPWYRNLGRKEPTVDRRVAQKHLKPIGIERYKKDGRPKLDKDGNTIPVYPKAEFTTDAPYTEIKLVPFNPGSRLDIADRLKRLFGWKPLEFTSDGHPKVDEEILSSLPYPEAQLLTKYLMIQKRLGQLADGKEAWLKHVKNGRIHGQVNTNGAVTGRMTHSKPNMAQVPSGGAPYGHECRTLFVASPGKKLVGCDADALELRDLAGYMARYDGGAYIATVLEGKKELGTDMHTMNAKALGCDRDTAKTWFYAFIYGSGDFNLGCILGVKGTKQQITNAGKLSRAKFLKALPALNKLVSAVKAKCKTQGWIKGLDGRVLTVRSEHSALNTLLQSAGAIQMKRALVILDNQLQEMGLIPGVHYEFVGNIHDEWQIEVDEDKATLVGKTAANAIRLAGEYYQFRCPLAGNYDVGNNWNETH